MQGPPSAPRSFTFALAGDTIARVSADYKPATGSRNKESANLDGLRLAPGFEQGLPSTAFTKVEYRYSNYEADTVRHQIVAGF